MLKSRPIDAMYPDTVSTPDAARAAGLTYRQIWYWIALKAIVPAHGTGGSGNPYRFTKRQAEHLRQVGHLYHLLEEMGANGPTTDMIRKVWTALEETGTYRYTNGPLVIELPWPPPVADDELPAGA
jgi:hypothetical protein